MEPTPRGALIAIEGLDRAGKSTQHARLCEHLEAQGHRVKRLRFPDRTTPIGASISSYLQSNLELEDHAIHLLFSANRWEAAPSIIAAIEGGTTVVVDRYYYSGIVYSSAKNKEDLTLQWARTPEVGLPKPDLVVFLDISTDAAKARGGYGDEKYENEAMQTRVRELFFEVIRMEGKGEGGTKIVDASKSADEVSGVVNRVADDLLRGKRLGGPLRKIEP
ncbi:MAG: hypothetical protein Q9164_000783 [Protoblastenia rupestris]